MADVSLDDLIKQDREKHKAQRTNTKTFKKKVIHKQRNQNEPKPNANQPYQQSNKPHFKNKHNNKPKFQGKKFQHAENTQRPNKFKQNKPREEPKDEETEQKDKQFRTLKVMGLSPEFTNEDLYKLFATEGAMQKCLIEQDNFGRSLNTAIVKYHNPEHAKSAIQNLNRHKIMNCVLTVQPYKNVKK